MVLQVTVNLSLYKHLKLMWRIDPLLRSDSVNSGHCYLTPATYTRSTIKNRVFYVVRVATVAMQLREKHASTTVEGLCVLRGPCQSCYKEDNWGDPNS
jgi:hypothetical protein